MNNKRLGERLIDGLLEAVDHDKGKITLRESQVSLPSEPPTISKADIVKIRKTIFQMSQPVFAKLLGVSPACIRAWEQGHNEPSGSVRRLMQLLIKDPQNTLKTISEDKSKKLKVGWACNWLAFYSRSCS